MSDRDDFVAWTQTRLRDAETALSSTSRKVSVSSRLRPPPRGPSWFGEPELGYTVRQ